MGWSRSPLEVVCTISAVVVVLGSHWLLWDWAIEDSAISLAYARNLAEGLGPVPYPGAPATEGFSNPTWVAWMVPWIWLGFDPFTVMRTSGLVMGLAGVFAMMAAARPTLGPRGASFAGLAFATFAPQAVWASSGLENPLYNLLLALGVWRLQMDGRRSWAALCFLGLALTRPEAAGLAAVGFVAAVAWAVPTGQVGERVRGWVLWALVPFLGWHALRYLTFAAELPATAYVKVDRIATWDRWTSHTWAYVQRFAVDAGFMVWLPAMFLAAGGAARRRPPVTGRAIALVATTALVVGGVGRWTGGLSDDMALYLTGGVTLLVSASACLQGGVRAFLGLVAVFGLAFSLLSGGDWMRGFRWFSLLAVPIAYGIGAVAEEAILRLPRRLGSVAAAGVLALFVGHQMREILVHRDRPGTSPGYIARRVRHYEHLIDTLHLLRRPLVIDQDMGANLFWGGVTYDVRDAKGLTDLPIALHRPRIRAVDSILADDRFERPAFVHLHVATKRVLRGRRWFRDEYVEVPGYVDGSKLHTGQFVRRDLLLGRWRHKRRPAAFDGVEVVGWQTRSPEVSEGTGLLFEIGVRLTEPAKGPIDLLLTARGPNDTVLRWSLPLGYDLLPPTEWEVGEVFVGRYPLRLRRGIPEGTYRLELAVQQGDTMLLPAKTTVPLGAGRADVGLGAGLNVVDGQVMRQEAFADLDELDRHTRKRSCHSAEAAWEDALAHRIRSRDWRAMHEPDARERIATCWGNRASKKVVRLRATIPDVPEGVESPDAYLEEAAWEVLRGRTWDPTAERLVVAGHRVGAALEARARTAEAQGDDEATWTWLSWAARVDPTRPFLQRRVERMRAERLRLEDRLGPLP